MQSRLIVKNFGPLKDIDVTLKNVNVFIGPQASGKSALAKLFTIFKAPRKFLKDFDKDSTNDKSEIYLKAFKTILDEYNISSFLNEGTEIKFESELHLLSFQKGKINYEPKLSYKIQKLENLGNDFLDNFDLIQILLNDFKYSFPLILIRLFQIIKNNPTYEEIKDTKIELRKITEEQFSNVMILLKELELNLSSNSALYIPAERNFINIIKNASLNLLNNNVPIPKHILSFGAELEKATIKEIDLEFLQKNLSYKSINGEDRVFTSKEHSIKLTEAASGIQSVLPILIPIFHKKELLEHQSFVIEEPELNLFPTAQYELIKLLELGRRESDSEDSGTIHTYTTHSPYILSAINNLLYANKVTNFLIQLCVDEPNDKFYEKTSKLVGLVSEIVKAQVNPQIFTAYQISDGSAQSIFNEEIGLINDNYIDEASDKIGDDFDALMELMSEYKHAVK
jgi:predicted ATPase